MPRAVSWIFKHCVRIVSFIVAITICFARTFMCFVSEFIWVLLDFWV